MVLPNVPIRSISDNNGQPRNPPEPFPYNGNTTARAVTRSLSNSELEKTTTVIQKSKYFHLVSN